MCIRDSPKDVGTWPVVPRVAVLLVLVTVILLAGWWFLWNEQLDTLAARQQEEIKLRDEFVAKKTQAVNLDLYTQQLTEIDRSLDVYKRQVRRKRCGWPLARVGFITAGTERPGGIRATAAS